MLVSKNAPCDVSATKGATSLRRSRPTTKDAEQFASGAGGLGYSGHVASSDQSGNWTAGAAALDLSVLSSNPVGDEWRHCRLLPHASRVCRGRVVTAALLHHRNDAAEDGDAGDDAQRLVVGAYSFMATWG